MDSRCSRATVRGWPLPPTATENRPAKPTYSSRTGNPDGSGAVSHHFCRGFDHQASGRKPAPKNHQFVPRPRDADTLLLIEVLQTGSDAVGSAHHGTESHVIAYDAGDRLEFCFRVAGTEGHDADSVLAQFFGQRFREA